MTYLFTMVNIEGSKRKPEGPNYPYGINTKSLNLILGLVNMGGSNKKL